MLVLHLQAQILQKLMNLILRVVDKELELLIQLAVVCIDILVYLLFVADLLSVGLEVKQHLQFAPIRVENLVLSQHKKHQLNE